MPRAVSQKTLDRRAKREERRKLRAAGELPPITRKPRQSAKTVVKPTVITGKSKSGTPLKVTITRKAKSWTSRTYVPADGVEDDGKRRRKKGREQKLLILANQEHPANMTPDRTSWLDVDGNPPVFDTRKPFELAQPFTLALYDQTGRLVKTERFGTGCVLPAIVGNPDAARNDNDHEEVVEEPGAPIKNTRRARIEREVKDRVLSRTSSDKRSGRRWKDEDLTPEQLAKREKRRQRREARKARR